MELLKDYDVIIHYNPSKDNIVAYALSRKEVSTLAYLGVEKRPFVKEI